MCARPPGDTVAREQRGEAVISRRATASRRTEEKRRERRSTVTPLVWSSRPRAEGHRWRDGHNLAVVRFDDLPSTLVDHAVMPVTEQDQVVQVRPAAMDPVDDAMGTVHLSR